MGCVFMGGGTRFVNGARKKKSVLRAGFAAAFLTVCGVYAQTKNVKPMPSVSTFKDSRDGKTYKKAAIGTQTWMGQNLNYAAKGSVCYDNHAENCARYGRLYDWNTALKACPAGFHLPTDKEWTALTDYVGGSKTAGTKLKSTSDWYNNGNGTNNYEFSALPGGYCYVGDFGLAGFNGYWWSATENDTGVAWYRNMGCYNEYVGRFNYDKNYLMSVRCVQD